MVDTAAMLSVPVPAQPGFDATLPGASNRVSKSPQIATSQTTAPRVVGVIAHRDKSLGGGLDELRKLITARGVEELIWYEVDKSRQAPKKVRQALARTPDRLFVWGGDGMVQRCLDAAVGSDVPVAILPAGTANVLAHNVGIPEDLAEAVDIGFDGGRMRLDLGRVRGEHFATMAGLGFDADMINDVDGPAKERFGRLTYIWAGLREVGGRGTKMTVKIDGSTWYRGRATCLLIGNVGRVLGGMALFDDARPDDGWLDVGVCTAKGATQWARALATIGTGPSDRSPFVRTTRARRITVRLRKSLRYELDGGPRTRVARLKIRIAPHAVTICAPDR
jgi:YegS/Rv2252/BmrU family lipid kinase